MAELISRPSASLSRGLTAAMVGPAKSDRSTAPRSMNTFWPNPAGVSTSGSSTRSCPVTSVSGARIGESEMPIRFLTCWMSNRSSNEPTELSMAATAGPGRSCPLAASRNSGSVGAQVDREVLGDRAQQRCSGVVLVEAAADHGRLRSGVDVDADAAVQVGQDVVQQRGAGVVLDVDADAAGIDRVAVDRVVDDPAEGDRGRLDPAAPRRRRRSGSRRSG